MNKVLLVGGQTGTGKTEFAVTLAKKFNGELIAADSRQVFKKVDIISGKDKDKIDVPIWLYDLVDSNEAFSVAKWHEKAIKTITDIQNRNKLPIVVGGTGLYLRSLVENLEYINVPRNEELRKQNLGIMELQKMVGEKYLAKMNSSDRLNPRRLIRAIETKDVKMEKSKNNWEVLSVVLICNNEELRKRIAKRIQERILVGAFDELAKLNTEVQSKFLANFDSEKWLRAEFQYARRQRVFFKKYFSQNMFDITEIGWREKITDIISLWVNI